MVDDLCVMELGVSGQGHDSRLRAGITSYNISTETRSLSPSDLSRILSNPSEAAPHDELGSQHLATGSAGPMARQMAPIQTRASIDRDSMAEDVVRLASSADGTRPPSMLAARVEAVEATIRNIEARVSSALESVSLAHRVRSDRASMGHDTRRRNAPNLLTPQALLDAQVPAIESALPTGVDGTCDLVPGASAPLYARQSHDRNEDYVPPPLRSEPLVNDTVVARANLLRTLAREGSAEDEARGEQLGLVEEPGAEGTERSLACAFRSGEPPGSLGGPSGSSERRFVFPLQASSAIASTGPMESCPSVRVSSTSPRPPEASRRPQGNRQDTAISEEADGGFRRQRAFASSSSTVDVNPVPPEGLSTPVMNGASPGERGTTANGVVEGRFELGPVWIDGWQHGVRQPGAAVSGVTNASRVHDSPGSGFSGREMRARIAAARRRLILGPGGFTRGPRSNALGDASVSAEQAEGRGQYPASAGCDDDGGDDAELELARNPAMLRARDDVVGLREWLAMLWGSNRPSETSRGGDASRLGAARGSSLPLSRRPRDEAQRGGRVILEAGDRVEHMGRLRQHSTSALNALRRVVARLRRGEETLRNARRDSRRPTSRQGHLTLSSRGTAGQNLNLGRNLTTRSPEGGEATDRPDVRPGHPARDGDEAETEEGSRFAGSGGARRSADGSAWAAEGRNPGWTGAVVPRDAVLRRRAWLRQELGRFREQSNQNLIRLLRAQQDHLRVRLRQVSTLSDIVDSVHGTVGTAMPPSRLEDSSIDCVVTEILEVLRNLLELLPTGPQPGTGAAFDATAAPGVTEAPLEASPGPEPSSRPSELAVSAVVEGIAVALQSACRMIDITSTLGVDQRADVSRRVMGAVVEALPRLDAAISAVSGPSAADGRARVPPALGRLGPEGREVRPTCLEAATASFPEVPSPSGGGAPSDCVICLSEAREGEGLCRLPCDHVFHRLCIAKWLRIQPSCPTCRQNVPAPRRSRVLRSLWREREGYGGAQPPSDGEA